MSIGQILRAKREELDLTQDELAAETGISKPYLSAIETGRATNPPSEGKIRKLEKALSFAPGQLLRLARLERSPTAVRDELERLRAENRKYRSLFGGGVDLDALYKSGKLAELTGGPEPDKDKARPAGPQIDAGTWVPVINRLSAGYPAWTGDLDYPPGIADDYIRCPDCHDPSAFGVRVNGDSMEPRYHQDDLVVFSPAATVTDGDDCFIRLADTAETTFKRVFFEDNGQRIRLQPRNERYAPTSYGREQITALYKAILRVERL